MDAAVVRGGEEERRRVVVVVDDVDGEGGRGGQRRRPPVGQQHGQRVQRLLLSVQHGRHDDGPVPQHAEGTLLLREARRQQRHDHRAVGARVLVRHVDVEQVPDGDVLADVIVRPVDVGRVVVDVSDRHGHGSGAGEGGNARVHGVDGEGDDGGHLAVEGSCRGDPAGGGVDGEEAGGLGVQGVGDDAVDAVVSVGGRHAGDGLLPSLVLPRPRPVHPLRELGGVVVDVADDDAEAGGGGQPGAAAVAADEGHPHLRLLLAVQRESDDDPVAVGVQLLQGEMRVQAGAVHLAFRTLVEVLHLQRAHESSELDVLGQHGRALAEDRVLQS